MRRLADVKRERAAADFFPDFIDALVVCVRAGLAPATAIITVAADTPAPLAGYLESTIHLLQRGERLADALEVLREQLAVAVGVVDALATADRYGLALEPVLDLLAGEAREARRQAAARDARTLPVRLSFPLVLCTLPSFVLCTIAPALLGALSTLRQLAP